MLIVCSQFSSFVLTDHFFQMQFRLCSLAPLLVLGLSMPVLLAGDGRVGYNKDVRPILSDKCFYCHGPDKTQNKAGLRLDTAEGAFAALSESAGHGIVKGKPQESAIYQRIISEDPDEVMPPPSRNMALKDHEKAIIEKWIAQGADYEPHWSFVTLPAEVVVPSVATPAWPKNPIDHFVLQHLESEKLTPSPAAEPMRWFRRVTLDLTGLPPKPEAIAVFEKDLATDADSAYSKAVDSLLASHAYGETMAMPWLDGARYTDTFGYHSDSTFTPWPYRDWVVQAFNTDMPYDKFVTWNLAGDLLPDATREQKLATVFNRLHRITNEGGSIFDEFFVDGVADRVHTVGTVMLGLTMECCRCHDHKYDPITQKDYYSMFAFFNNINETGVYNHEAISPPPSLLLPTDGQTKKLEELKAALAGLEGKWKTAAEAGAARFAAWLADGGRSLHMADITGHFTFDEKAKPFQNHVATVAEVSDQEPEKEDDKKNGKEADDKTKGPKPYSARLDKPEFVPGKFDTGVKLDGDRGVVFENYFMKDRWHPFTISLWMKDNLRDKKPVAIAQRCFGHDVGYNGIELSLADGVLEARVFRSWPDNGIGVKALAKVPQSEWAHLGFSYDGSGKAAGLKIFLNGMAIETAVTGDRLYKRVGSKTYQPGFFMVGSIFRGRGFRGGEVDEMKVFNRPLTSLEMRELAGSQTLAAALASGTETSGLREFYFSSIDAECRQITAEIEAARKAVVDQENSFVEVPVMEEMKTERPSWILARGAYDAPKTDDKLVKRETLSALVPFPAEFPRDRHGFAKWLTLPNHPLTSRVMVNRVWQQFFGRGLVGTSENFGLQGELPLQPELLDWLARDLINHGWSLKHLCRQIVLSATYRQQSGCSTELHSRDPENRLLARGPSHRLSGEMIRDLALAASGLMDKKASGPPVRPYDPVNNGDPKLNQVHARSLYSYWRRTKPIANMIALDRPSLEVCVVRRSRTNSPAQALVLLNDTQFVEAARALATDVVQKEADPAQRIKLAWLRLTGVQPAESEHKILQDIYTEQRAEFANNPAGAKQLLKLGLKPAPKGIDEVDAAAFTVVCQAILNSDAAVWKR